VLGKKINAGGIKDAEQVLDLLAKNRHTAHHISLQLRSICFRRPAGNLVKRMSKTFEKSKATSAL